MNDAVNENIDRDKFSNYNTLFIHLTGSKILQNVKFSNNIFYERINILVL